MKGTTKTAQLRAMREAKAKPARPIRRVEDIGDPHLRQVVAEKLAESVEAVTKKTAPVARKGKEQVSVWLDKALAKAVRVTAVQREMTIEALIAEALKDYLKL